ncbi:MAG: class I SAM-dependent methyltransferase [Bacteroidales bacterium]|jgi:SAM-dependent methyltransferase|nr:class I SAM-dependent methyltransferase [Bacteroidales bacterium]
MKQKYIHDEITHNMKDPNIIIPLVLHYVKPKSVVDFGCGIGTWLNAFKNNGISEILGIDGEWCKKDLLFKYIQKSEFKCVNLENPIYLEKTYDLVVSLEVAEHLSETSADIFVQSLTNAGKVILFSAAFPGQGGQNHINEQWPSYWASKFQKYGYYFHDIIRGKIWNNQDVSLWYKQNIFLVIHESVDFNYPNDNLLPLDYNVIHLDYYKKVIDGEKGIFLYFKLALKSTYYKLARFFGKKP